MDEMFCAESTVSKSINQGPTLNPPPFKIDHLASPFMNENPSFIFQGRVAGDIDSERATPELDDFPFAHVQGDGPFHLGGEFPGGKTGGPAAAFFGQ